MKAVILAAGKGTRLPDVSKMMPKVMVPINGKPLLQWHIEHLKKQRITDIYINLHYMPEKITDYFGDGKKFDVSITYSYEKELLGTGGALVPFAKHLDDDFLLLFGDVVTIVDFHSMYKFHKQHNSIVTGTIHPSHHPEDSDLVEYDENYKVLKILKKPHFDHTIPEDPHNLAALYLFSRESNSFLPNATPFDLEKNLLPIILEKTNRFFAYNTDEFVMDIGTPARLDKAKSLLKG